MVAVPAKMLPKGLPVTGQLKFQKYGVAMRFAVTITGIDLGNWSSCEGLKVTFNTEQVTNGGHYDHKLLLPKDISYDHITLRRAMIKKDSDKVRKWLSNVADKWMDYDPGDESYQGETGSVTLLDITGQIVQTWGLSGVHPVSWSGPSLNAKQSDIAMETLVLEHEGFLR